MIKVLGRILICMVMTLLTIGEAYSGEVLKIGLAPPLTGDMAPYSEALGAKCMAEMINEKSGSAGITVELFMEDCRSQPELASTIVQKYLDAGAVMVHGICWPDSLIPVSKMASPYNAFVFSAQTTEVEMNDLKLENFIQLPAPDDVPASAMATTVYDKGARTAAIFTSKDGGSWTANTPVWFGEAFEKLGGKVIKKLNHSIGTTDYSPQITEIMNMKPNKPDVIYVCSVVPDVGILARQLVAAGYKGWVVGCDGFDDPSLEATVGSKKALSKVMFTSHMPTTPDTPAGKFLKSCKLRGYKVHGVFDVLGGDMMQVLVEGAKIAGTTKNGMKILEAIRNNDKFNLMSGGSISFKEKGTWPVRKIPVIGFKDGNRMVVSSAFPEFIPHSK